MGCHSAAASFSSAVLAQITGNTGFLRLLEPEPVLADRCGCRRLSPPCRRIESLTIDRMPITSTGIATLNEVAQPARELNVYGDNLTDAEMPAFEGFTWLRTLCLTSSKIRRNRPPTNSWPLFPNAVVNPWRWKHTVADLRGMSKDLQTDPAGNVIALNMSCLKWATDDKMRVIADFPTITRLRIFGGSDLTDLGLQYVKNLPNLAVIEINSKQVTVAGLKHLRGHGVAGRRSTCSRRKSRKTGWRNSQARQFAGRALDRRRCRRRVWRCNRIRTRLRGYARHAQTVRRALIKNDHGLSRAVGDPCLQLLVIGVPHAISKNISAVEQEESRD